MNLRIITKYHAADQEIGFFTKSISKPYGYGTAMPTAWELNLTLDPILSISLDFRNTKFYAHNSAGRIY